jgi:ubiquinone/menaquinone biosynthesis C-methylase UbiE
MHAVQRPRSCTTLVQADGVCLPFRAQTFDIVVCSTMLHHLDWHQGIALLYSMAAVARHGVVVNDLVRGRLHYYAARLVLPVVARNHVTRHDGPLSVLRAYSVEEVREMARLAGLAHAHVDTTLGYRFVLVYVPPAGGRQATDGG